MTKPVLEVSNLEKIYRLTSGLFAPPQEIRAVAGVSLAIERGETLGLVGESGCGKSTLSRMINLLEAPTTGSIRIHGNEVASLDARARHKLRRRIQMVFQDPYSSINPRMTVGRTVREPLDNFRVGGPHDRSAMVRELLSHVGLHPDAAFDYPHEFSGGQRQRIAIARALALDPDIIIADEPVSALDVSVQAQILNLLQKLREDKGLTMLFVSHDLSVVRHVSDRIAVMYLGQVMEVAPTETLFASPQHPYTRALVASAPPRHPRHRREKTLLSGDIPSPSNMPSGCPFHTRCELAEPRCAMLRPELVEIAPAHNAACHVVVAQATPRRTFAGAESVAG